MGKALQELDAQKGKERQELDAQKGKERQDWGRIRFNPRHLLETGKKLLGWEKNPKKEQDFCWDRKVHSTTSQFSGQYCECEVERSEAETKIRKQTPDQR